MQTQITQDRLHPDRRITSGAVRELCGGVSDMCIYRWLQDESKKFPKPQRIGNRRYWREADVLDWLNNQA